MVFPLSLEQIGAGAFHGCRALKYVHFGSPKDNASLGCIGSNTFSDCVSLTSIDIPLGVCAMGPLALSGCTSLRDVTLPSSLTTIGHQSFERTALTRVVVPSGVVRIEAGLFF